MTNNVKPNHYQGNKGDLLSSMDGFMSDDEIRGFYKGNIIKYTTRYNKKNGLEDLDKANYYIERLKEWEASKSNVEPLQDIETLFKGTPLFNQSSNYDNVKRTNDLIKASAKYAKEMDISINESLGRMARATTIKGLK